MSLGDKRLIDQVYWKINHGYRERSSLSEEELSNRKVLKLTKQEQLVLDEVRSTRASVSVKDGGLAFKFYRAAESLNARDKAHWGVKIMRKAIWDGVVRKALESCKDVLNIPFSSPVVIVYRPYRKRLLDEDNSFSGLKFIVDSMVYNGVLKDDSPRYVYQYIPHRQVKVKSDDEVRVELDLVPVADGCTVDVVIRPPTTKTLYHN